MVVLSKSRFLAGLQCPLRLWYTLYEPDLATEPSPFRKALFRMGQRVGELARERYPGGVLIEEDYLHHYEAMRSTLEVLQRPDVRAVFEGAFLFDNIRIRIDILERVGGESWNLVEVKSGVSVKNENLYDLAIQYYVLVRLGYEIRQAALLTLNRDYVYDGRSLDVEALFVLTDLKEQVVKLQDQIAGEMTDLRAMLAREEPPGIEPSRHCQKPYACEFFDHCRKRKPEYWVADLAGIQQDRLDELGAMGVFDIRDIPEWFPLSPLQSRIRECVVRDQEYVRSDLGTRLETYEPPIHFLDFEAVAPPIPLYAGTHPYQMLPFQWSDHVLSAEGTLVHREYLCDEDRDPREDVARTLLEALGGEGTICTYTTFESQVIGDLAAHLPKYREPLRALLSRCRDLCEDIRRGYYHPRFRGSFSIKNVLPALVPSMSYKELSIQEGGQAGLEYLRMIDPGTPREERERIRRDLLTYCRQDTLAMVKIREELLKRAG